MAFISEEIMSRFNYAALQDMDYVFCTSMSIFALAIRQREVGFGRIFNLDIATHEARIVSMIVNGVRVVYVAEMMKTDDGQAGDLKIHPLSTYLPDRSWKDHVCDIKRHTVYSTNYELRKMAVDYIFSQWKLGKTRYDVGGCLKWDFPFLKDKKSEYYCSEFSEHIDQDIAGFSSVNLMGKSDDVIPYTHQCAESLEPVKLWKV
jgi:hypothetical protein